MYAERIVYLNPNFMFDKLVLRQQMLEQAGWLDCSNLQIPSVIVLKRELGGFPAGTKFMWACGSDNDMTSFQAFGDESTCLKEVAYHIIDFFQPTILGDLSEICSGIDFDDDDPTENQWMSRYPTRYYACLKIPRSAYLL